MDNTPTISVIVPVYNVDKYLPKCIDSILAQTYKNFELLLIDDGSTDNSGKICDEYAARESRISVYHKENGGVSSARNFGVDIARGEWLTFFDGDDTFEKDTLEICASYFSNYDIVRFSIKFDYGDTSSIVSINEDDTLDNYKMKVISRDAILGVCVGFYKKELFNSNNIRFDRSLVSGEDWLVQFQLLVAAKSIKFLNAPLYIYNKQNETSATTVFKFESHYSALKALKKIQNMAETNIGGVVIIKNAQVAEAQLVYDFLASKIVRRKLISHKSMFEYRKLVNLTIKNILKLKINNKQKILLSLYVSPIGRFLFFK